MSGATAERLTREELLEREKAESARVLSKLMSDLDITQDELARWCGVRPWLVSRWCSREWREMPGGAHIRMFPPLLAVGYGRWLMDPHAHCVVETPVPEESGADIRDRFAASLVEQGEASGVVAAALKDGRIDSYEAPAVERELSEAIDGLVAVREGVRKSMPTRLVPRRTA